MATMSPLRRRMIDDMMVRNLSPATQQSYIYAVRRFSEYFNKSPDRLGIEDVRTYQLHLIAQQRSWSHINSGVVRAPVLFWGHAGPERSHRADCRWPRAADASRRSRRRRH